MPTQCENCAAALQGDFCSQCGQSAKDFNLPIADFARELASEAFSLDSRLLRTLKSLFLQPGAVPRGYMVGHRARFVPPVRLYIFASFAMFLIMSLGSGLTVRNVSVGSDVPSVIDSVTAVADTTPAIELTDTSPTAFGARLQDRFVRGLQRMDADSESFSRVFLNRLAQAMFFLLPAFAVLLKLAHRRRYYVQHLVFAVYFHSFVFLLVSVVLFPDALGLDGLGEWFAIALLATPVYLVLAMKRFYAEPWGRTLAKFVFVSVTYTFLGAATWIAVLVASLLTA